MRRNKECSVKISSERRDCERMHTSGLPVFFKGKDYQEAYGKVQDISLSGMFLETQTQEKVGNFINADIDGGDTGLIIWTQGRIVRVSKDGIGVQFTGLDEKGLGVYLCTHKV